MTQQDSPLTKAKRKPSDVTNDMIVEALRTDRVGNVAKRFGVPLWRVSRLNSQHKLDLSDFDKQLKTFLVIDERGRLTRQTASEFVSEQTEKRLADFGLRS